MGLRKVADPIRWHGFQLSVSPDEHLENLPAREALEGVGQQDGEGEKDPAHVHQVVGPAVVVQEIP